MNNNLPDFKIGIVGCGRISQAYYQAIQFLSGQLNRRAGDSNGNSKTPKVRLTSVMDLNPDVVKNMTELANCEGYTELDAFAEKADVDGVIVCAPPKDHREITCTLLDQGIHVLCEKPFATRVEDAKAMIKKSEEENLVLMMASKFRYVEDLIRAKSMLASGMLGKILFFENRFCSKVNMQGRWNVDTKVAGGGVIIDNGTHSVDITRYLLGKIDKINAQETVRILNTQVEDTANLSLVTENGSIGSVYLSWGLQTNHTDYINIAGTDGEIRIGWKESKYQYNGHKEWIAFGVGYNKIEAFKKQVVNFVETARGAAEPLIGLGEALESVKVIDAAYESMKFNRWIHVEDRSSEPQIVMMK